MASLRKSATLRPSESLDRGDSVQRIIATMRERGGANLDPPFAIAHGRGQHGAAIGIRQALGTALRMVATSELVVLIMPTASRRVRFRALLAPEICSSAMRVFSLWAWPGCGLLFQIGQAASTRHRASA